jgi:hypothetical protein
MLEPSPDNPMNIESYSYFISNREQFDSNVQKSITGDCVLSGIQFRSVLNNNVDFDDGRMDLTNSSNVYESKQFHRNKRKEMESSNDFLNNNNNNNNNFQWEERENNISMMITECCISDDRRVNNQSEDRNTPLSLNGKRAKYGNI